MEDQDKKKLAQKNCKDQKTTKSKKLIWAKKTKTFRAKNLNIQSRLFLTFKIKKSFTKLRQAFVETLILNHFDLKCHIEIETDVLGYAIGGILSQLTLDNLGWWYLVVFFFGKIIPIETHYETHNGELLAIIEVFKTWKYYLKGCKHEVFVLINCNNLQHFIDTKSLSFK